MILPVRRLSSNGLKPGAQAVHKGYEGLVGKDPESSYVGGRTLKWLKVKVPKYRESEAGNQVANRASREVRRGLACRRSDLGGHLAQLLPRRDSLGVVSVHRVQPLEGFEDHPVATSPGVGRTRP